MDHVSKPWTVGELRDQLADYAQDTPVRVVLEGVPAPRDLLEEHWVRGFIVTGEHFDRELHRDGSERDVAMVFCEFPGAPKTDSPLD